MHPPFSDLVDSSHVAAATGVPAERIEEYVRSLRQSDHYDALHIPKKGRRRKGPFRTVYKARQYWLAQFHRMIAILVATHTRFPEYVQGFVHKRSTKKNAKRHLGARLLLHADLANFFDSITLQQVEAAFRALGSSASVANLIARACTIDGFLRQGTRCSPAIANVVCRQMDVDLDTLSNATGSHYSRYADDLTFSGDRVPDAMQVEQVVRSHGFELRDGRCYTQYRGRAQYVTGLTISDLNGPRLPRRVKRQMRLVLHYIGRHGVDDHFARANRRGAFADQPSLEGWLLYFHAIEPELARKLRVQFREGMNKSRLLRGEPPLDPG